MGNTARESSWERIQRYVKETERLIGQKQYNLAMVKARQTLEYMVKCLGERACIVDGDLMETIDELYQGRWISKSTCEHFHKIRIIGNKAVHENSDNAYDANRPIIFFPRKFIPLPIITTPKKEGLPHHSSSHPVLQEIGKSGAKKDFPPKTLLNC